MLGPVLPGKKTFFQKIGAAISKFLTKKVVSWTLVAATVITGVKGFRQMADMLAKGQDIMANKTAAGGKIPVIYGTRRVGAQIVYMDTAQNRSKDLFVVYAISVGECEEILGRTIEIDGNSILDGNIYKGGGYVGSDKISSGSGSLNTASQVGDNQYSNAGTLGTDPTLRYSFVFNLHHGASSQTADPMLRASIPTEWTTNHKLNGICYIAASFDYDKKGMYKGVPQITVQVKGKKVYDPRTDTTAWSSNPALCFLDYIQNDEYGKGLATSQINMTTISAAANKCDTLVDQPYYNGNYQDVTWSGDSGDDFIVIDDNADWWQNKVDEVIDIRDASDTVIFDGVDIKGTTRYEFYDATQENRLYIDGTLSSSYTNEAGSAKAKVKRFHCNGYIDTNKNVMDNAKELLSNMRGILNYVNGKYELQIEDTGSSTFSITDDHIIADAGISVDYGNKDKKANKVVIEFFNANKKYELDTATVLHDASPDYYSDDGEVLEIKAEFPYVTDPYIAYNMGKAILTRSRNQTTMQFLGTPEMYKLNVGDIVDLTYSGLGFSGKICRVEALELQANGLVSVSLIEYFDVYTWEVPAQESTEILAKIPTIGALKPPQANSIVFTDTDASSISRPTLTWTEPTDFPVRQYRVDVVDSSDNNVFSKIVDTPSVDLAFLPKGSNYEASITAFNGVGIESNASTKTFTIADDPVKTTEVEMNGVTLSTVETYGTVTNKSGNWVKFLNKTNFGEVVEFDNGLIVDSGTARFENAPTFVDGFTGQGTFEISQGSIQFGSYTPSTTTNSLYNVGGSLYWNGQALGTGTGDITAVVAGTNLNGGGTSGSVTLNLDSTITGDHTFSNNIIIQGNLTVQGTTTSVNTDDLNVKDKNITLNYSTGDSSASANGAGITIQDAVSATQDATLTWNTANDSFNFSHNLNFTDNVKVQFGAGNDLQIWHGGIDSYIVNETGDLDIINKANDKDISFYSDDGSGGHTEYFRLDGGNGYLITSKHNQHLDNVKSMYGGSNDLQIYHDGFNSFVKDAGTGNLKILADNLLLQRADQSQTYIQALTGGAVDLRYAGEAKLATTSSGINVTGTTVTDGLTVNSGDTSSFLSIRNGSNNSFTKLYSDLNGVTVLDVDANNVGSAPRFQIDVSEVQAFRITEGNDIYFYEDTGSTAKFFWDASAEKLAIGTTTANAAFTVNHALPTGQPIAEFRSTGNSHATIDLRADGTGDPRIFFDLNGATPFAIGVDNSDGDKFKISGNYQLGTNDRFVIDASGNAMLGKTSVDAGATQGFEFRADLNDLLYLARAGNAITLNRLSSDGDIALFRKDGTTVGSIGAKSDDVYIVTGDTGIRFNDGNDQIWPVSSSGASRDGAIDLGNSGVRFKDLHLSGTAYANNINIQGSFTVDNEYTLPSASGSAGQVLKYPATGSQVIWADDDTQGTTINNNADNRIITGSGTANTLNAEANFTYDGSRITTTSNSALGTTFTLANTNSGGGREFTFISNSTGNFYIYDDTANTTRFTIDSAGRVGIGTSSPSGELHVVGTGGGNGDVYVGRTSGAEIHTQAQSATGIFGTSTNHDLAFKTNDTQRMRIDTSGRVGVGTSSPDVYGIHASNSSNSVYFKSVSGSIQTLYGGATALGYGLLGTTTNHPLVIYTNNSERARIDSSGNFLVGATSVSNSGKITVDGGTNGNGIYAVTDASAGYAGAVIERSASNGNLIIFKKSTAVVGTINTLNGDISIGTGDTGFRFHDGNDYIEPFNVSTNSFRDNAISLGTTGSRFKDLHLSGTANVGETLSMSHTGNTSTLSFTQKVGTQNSVATISANREDTSSSASRLLFSTNNGTSTLQRIRINNGGDISFYEDTGTSIGFFWDASAESLGIGTTSIIGKLHANDSAGATLTLTRTSGATSGNLGKLRFGNTDIDSDLASIVAIQDGATNNSALTFGTQTSGYAVAERMRIDSSGKVGIGTDSPTMPLSVQAASNAYAISMHGRSDNYSELYGASNDGSTKYSFLQTHSAQTKLYTLVNTPLLFGTNSTERMRIDSSGNVGIGTSSPDAKLEVSGGTLKVTNSGNASIFINANAVGSDASIFFEEDDNVKAKIQHDASNDSMLFTDGAYADTMTLKGTSVGIGDTAPQDYLEINGSGRGLGGLTISNSSASHAALSFARSSTATARIKTSEPAALHTSALHFQTSNASGGSPNLLTAMYIDENQKVGIGASSPDGNLEVVASSVIDNTSDTVNNVLIGLQSANRPTIVLDTADTTYTNRTWNITNVGAVGSLVIGRNGLDVLNLKNDGKVGIGTSSPTEKLHVLGNTKITGNITVGASHTIGDVSAVDDNFLIASADNKDLTIKAGVDSSTLRLKTTNTALTINAEGLVTIEEATTINDDLTINATTPSLNLIDTNNNSDYAVNNANGVFQIFDKTNDVSRLSVTSAGLVGIGTTSPLATLHVGSGSGSLNTAAQLFIPNNDALMRQIKLGHGSGVANITTDDSSKPITLSAGGSERMRLDSSGNLLVGTTDTSVWNNGAGGNTGTVIESDGTIQLAKSNNITAYFNRLDSDGEILSFRKNGAGVGSIGTLAGDLLVGTGNTGLLFYDADPQIIPRNPVTGANVDATVDLGASGSRFKDLHLSGTINSGAINTTGITVDSRLVIDGASIYDNSTNGNNKGFRIGGQGLVPLNGSGTDTNNIVDIGTATYKFKDLYLSGEVETNTITAISTAQFDDTVLISGLLTCTEGALIRDAKSSTTDPILTIKNYSSTNTNGTYLDFVNNSDNFVCSIGTRPQDNTSNSFIIGGSGAYKTGLKFLNYTTYQAIYPATGDGATADDKIDLGASSARFDDIYATNGTIQTSDRNLKQDIQALTDVEQRVATACKGLIRRFRWQDSVAEKDNNPDSDETARYHFGVIAQDLQDAFEAEGLDAGDYGMFISSTWTDDDGVEQTRLGVRYNELLAFIISTL